MNTQHFIKAYFILFILLSIYLAIFPYNTDSDIIPRTYSVWHLLLSQADRFNDFINNFHNSKFLPQIDYPHISVPWQIILFRSLDANPSQINFFLTLSILATFYILFIVVKESGCKNSSKFYLGFFLAFNYPILFAIFRGNYEYLMTAILFYSFIKFNSREIKKSFAFYLIAVFIKPTCLLFGVLYLPHMKDNFRFFLKIGIFMSALVVTLTVLVLSDVNLHSLQELSTTHISMMLAYQQAYAIGEGGTLFNNSTWGFIKTYLLLTTTALDSTHDTTVLSIYAHVTKVNFVGLSVGLLMAVLLSGLSSWRSNVIAWGFVITSTILFVPVAADYRLAGMAILIYAFLSPPLKSDTTFLIPSIIVATIMLPKHVVHFMLTDAKVSVTLQSLANPILLLVLFFVLFGLGMQEILHAIRSKRNL